MNRTITAHNRARREDIGNLFTRVPQPMLSGPTPFLLLAHHGPQTLPPDNQGLPFTRHPHRGFETVTFIRKGSLTHEDSRTGARVVHAGGVQWMTAGSGITHSETAPSELQRDGGGIEILQLWLNLPNRLKSADPDYVGLEADEIPRLQRDDGRVSVGVVSGEFNGQQGGMQSLTGTTMLWVDLKEGGSITLPAPSGHAAFLYVGDGTVSVNGDETYPYTRVEFGEDGEQVQVTATSDAMLMYGHAPWIREPVAAHGPFVMTTREELVQAGKDYQAGKFV